MDTTETPAPEIPLAQEMGKAFAVSLAMTAGTLAGFMLIGTVLEINEKRKDRKLQKLQDEN